jgi:hypothetical protein
MRNLMGRHYLENLWPFLSAGYYVDVWEPPIDEFPEEPEQPPVEEPDPDMTPQQRIAWIRAQQQEQAAWRRAHDAWLAAIRAIEQRQAMIEAKKAYTNSWFTTQEERSKTFFESLRQMWKPRLARGVFAPEATKLDGALVQSVENRLLTPNFIESLLAARGIGDIRSAVQQPPTPSLLYLLLRHSMLLEYGAGAAKLTPGSRREPELVNLPGAPATSTIWDRLNLNVDVAGVGQKKVGEYLLGFLSTGEPDLARRPDLKPISDFAPASPT